MPSLYTAVSKITKNVQLGYQTKSWQSFFGCHQKKNSTNLFSWSSHHSAMAV